MWRLKSMSIVRFLTTHLGFNMDIKDLIDNIDFILYKHETCVSEIYRTETIELSLADARRLVDFAKSMQWQPIETAPKDGTHVLFYVDEYWIEGWFNIARNRFDYAWLPSHGIGDGGYDDPYPTAWMPLPQTPEE